MRRRPPRDPLGRPGDKRHFNRAGAASGVHANHPRQAACRLPWEGLTRPLGVLSYPDAVVCDAAVPSAKNKTAGTLRYRPCKREHPAARIPWVTKLVAPGTSRGRARNRFLPVSPLPSTCFPWQLLRPGLLGGRCRRCSSTAHGTHARWAGADAHQSFGPERRVALYPAERDICHHRLRSFSPARPAPQARLATSVRMS